MSTAESVIGGMEDSVVVAIDATKCAHELCDCPAGPEGKHCSTYCRDADRTEILEIKCDCAHDHCR